MMSDTYEMHRLDEDREHVLSAACWCRPVTLSYGAEPVYDEHGDIVGMSMLPDEDDAD